MCSGVKYFTLIACDLLFLKKGDGINSLNFPGIHVIGLIRVRIISVIFKLLLKENYYYV